MGFLNDFVYFNSGNECPEEFIEWAGLTVIAAVAGRKLWVRHGEYFTIFPNIYVVLVSEAGSGKSTARNAAKKMIRLVDPEYTVSASFQSHQDIIDTMCNMMPHTWKDETGQGDGGEAGKIFEYRPFLVSANELKSLLSTDAKGMVEFLVDIYDENDFSTGFKTYKKNNPEKKQSFDNPYLCLLACAVPKWFMGELKMDLFDGGLGRRLLLVYADKTRLIDTPVMPPNSEAALKRMETYLLQLKEAKGELVRTPEAMAFWKEWYNTPGRKNTDDPILKQFHETKHIQMLKLSSLLALSENPLTKTIEKRHLQQALIICNKLEKGVLLLTRGIGRNELAGVGARVLDFITRSGGACTKVTLLKMFQREFRLPEFVEQMNHYIQSEQLIVKLDATTGKEWYFIPELYQQWLAKNGGINSAPVPVAPSSASTSPAP